MKSHIDTFQILDVNADGRTVCFQSSHYSVFTSELHISWQNYFF